MTDPFDELKRLEERVKKAEERIPELESQLKTSQENAAKNGSGLVKLSMILGKYQEFQEELRALTGAPSASSGSSETLEVHDASAVIGVKDPKEKLVADTTTVIGQIGQAILDGYIVPKRMRVGEVEELLASHFNAKWGKGQVQMGLETLTAPPYRLFVHTIDPQRRHFFQLRETIKDRIVKE